MADRAPKAVAFHRVAWMRVAIAAISLWMVFGCGGVLKKLGERQREEEQARAQQAAEKEWKAAAQPVVSGDVLEITRSNAAELADHPERFKGKTLKIDSFVTLIPTGETLRGKKEAHFCGRYPGMTLNVTVQIPSSLVVPPAKNTDDLKVIFICREGSLTTGNEAISVARP